MIIFHLCIYVINISPTYYIISDFLYQITIQIPFICHYFVILSYGFFSLRLFVQNNPAWTWTFHLVLASRLFLTFFLNYQELVYHFHHCCMPNGFIISSRITDDKVITKTNQSSNPDHEYKPNKR